MELRISFVSDSIAKVSVEKPSGHANAALLIDFSKKASLSFFSLSIKTSVGFASIFITLNLSFIL
ncbi:hypothetical protein BpHYR1_028785 [Brachionus plicatilis]|uniref:Uncharacterized protein n=1 Tax=Brachionus plicatilis TaxID=10195 RepID=A0A3M7RT00_BRAPC|nr:hypothetical protein BpHYR1_028785 [Brachionus plicatilis]